MTKMTLLKNVCVHQPSFLPASGVNFLDMKRIRLDILVGQQYPHLSRAQIQSFIMQGFVSIDGKKMTKAGALVPADAHLELAIEEPRFVCRAGFKLDHALDYFNIDVRDQVMLDAGLSTGGFTDCLLQRGAKRVYGVDVGYGQVHEKIRRDARVIVFERTNLRYLKQLDEPIDIITLDLSFISVLKVMDAVCAVLKPDGQLIVLIKPQFEAEKGTVPRGGVIKDPDQHKKIVARVVEGIEQYGFVAQGVTESPILGSSGNKEFLAYFKRVPSSSTASS